MPSEAFWEATGKVSPREDNVTQIAAINYSPTTLRSVSSWNRRETAGCLGKKLAELETWQV